MNKQQNKSNDSKTIFIASFTFLDKNIRVPDMRQFQRLRSVLVFSSNRLTSKPCLYILHAVWEISAPIVNQKKSYLLSDIHPPTDLTIQSRQNTATRRTDVWLPVSYTLVHLQIYICWPRDLDFWTAQLLYRCHLVKAILSQSLQSVWPHFR